MNIKSINILIKKLDEFIRKYYLNSIIRGILLSFCLYFLFFTTISVLEYLGHFSVEIRTFLYYSTLFIFLIIFFYFILFPGLKYLRIGKILSYKQAAEIISIHFKTIQDKLINTLELANIEQTDIYSEELLKASIEQRISDIQPIPFKTAVNFRKNFKYGRFLIVILVVVLSLTISTPVIFTEGSNRIINYNIFYEPVSSFKVILENDSLSVIKGRDYDVNIKLTGTSIPDNILISYGGNKFLMKKSSKTKFSYKFNNVNNSIDFNFGSGDFLTQKYHLDVLPNPLIINFELFADIPDYTGESNIKISNIGDISVPAGTVLKWTFFTEDIDSLSIQIIGGEKMIANKQNTQFDVSKKVITSFGYSVSVINKFIKSSNIVKYNINVIPDLYPEINVLLKQDSINPSVYYFNGIINDDYGFSKLTFNYCTSSENIQKCSEPILLPVNKNANSQEFFYAFDFSTLITQPGFTITYYFEVWDNDGFQGAKSSRSKSFEFKIPTKEDIQKLADKANEGIQTKISQGLQLANELQNDLDRIKQNNINNKNSSYEMSRMLKEITNKQKDLEKILKQVSKQNETKNNLNNAYDKQQEDILEKQKQIEELLNNLVDEDLKKLIDEINKLQENFDPQKMNQLSEKLKENYEDLSKELDRNLELLKRYDVEEKVDKAIDRLDNLAEEQKNLAEMIEDEKKVNEDLNEKLQKQHEEFNKISDEYDKTKEQNKELEEPFDLKDFKKETEDIKKNFEDMNQNLQKGKEKKSSKGMKENSSKISKLAGSMKEMMQNNQTQTLSKNIQELRQILENLLTFSFSQEALMKDFSQIQMIDPKYLQYVQKQRNLKDDFKIIKDSLMSLAKETPQLNFVIQNEIKSLDREIDNSLLDLEARSIGVATSRQQLVMTSANNLALFLSEVLQSMQNQMSGGQGGNSKMNKPGPSSGGISQMKKQQQSLKSQLEQLLQQLKSGKGKQDSKQINKMIGKMIAQQEIFSKMINDLKKNSGLKNSTQKALQDIQQLMEQTKQELINKTVNQNTIKRQDQIITRLLESEVAEREREIEQKRESKEGKNQQIGNLEKSISYKQIEKSFKEELNMSNIKLFNFYKNKYKDYLLKLNQN